jgi:hypothetical protein
LDEDCGVITGRKYIEVIACHFTHQSTKEIKVSCGSSRRRKSVAIAWKRRRRRRSGGNNTRFVE